LAVVGAAAGLATLSPLADPLVQAEESPPPRSKSADSRHFAEVGLNIEKR
jgi:hypothetical protein